MEKIRKTPSGKWETRVYLGRDVHGKKITRRVSGYDRQAVKMEAAALEAGARADEDGGGTFGQALQAMINDRQSVLSPSTIRGYKACARILERDYLPFYNRRLRDIRTKDIQAIVNDLSDSGRAPKTVDNYYLLISVTLKYKGYRVDGVVLPEKEKPDLHIPDEATVRKTIEALRGTDLYVPVLLSAFGPMRRGEICALQPGDISGDIIHVQRAMAQGPDGWTIKPPKTYSSNRRLKMPQEIIDAVTALQPGEDGRLIPYNPNQLSDKFRKALHNAGIPHYRFHDLRHFCASYLHAQGVPDVYIQQRTGHASADVLHQVYTHAMTDQSEAYNNQIMGWFSGMIDTGK